VETCLQEIHSFSGTGFAVKIVMIKNLKPVDFFFLCLTAGTTIFALGCVALMIAS